MKQSLLLGCLVATGLLQNGWAEPLPARQTELRNLLKNDCGACHGLTLKGGMGPALLPENLAGKPDGLLVTTILEGRKGTAMPPWKPFMKREEVVWLVGVLRGGKSEIE
ncbi:MAG: cytochrome c [Methylovulum sp.]|uniref:c-type cytochrome n=1 Tax=Methylovulum sp. TaxID=1916980 RepID=UPI002614B689|nr:cytochrome c [Methylovulum sp.]MDD2724892.1 cytochrome c [Methylovulum sp.]MDD5124706.1 cytochrome c [Methylovulum sp.]